MPALDRGLYSMNLAWCWDPILSGVVLCSPGGYWSGKGRTERVSFYIQSFTRQGRYVETGCGISSLTACTRNGRRRRTLSDTMIVDLKIPCSRFRRWCVQQGTSDPVVYVEAFGQKFATEVVKDRLNAVFDETFVINLRNMDQDDFKEGVFR